MSDQDNATRDAARAKLDTAIREYADARNDGENRYVTGWQVTIGSTRLNVLDDEGSGMLYETAPGQTWYASVGLSVSSSDHYRGICAEED